MWVEGKELARRVSALSSTGALTPLSQMPVPLGERGSRPQRWASCLPLWPPTCSPWAAPPSTLIARVLLVVAPQSRGSTLPINLQPKRQATTWRLGRQLLRRRVSPWLRLALLKETPAAGKAGGEGRSGPHPDSSGGPLGGGWGQPPLPKSPHRRQYFYNTVLARPL